MRCRPAPTTRREGGEEEGRQGTRTGGGGARGRPPLGCLPPPRPWWQSDRPSAAAADYSPAPKKKLPASSLWHRLRGGGTLALTAGDSHAGGGTLARLHAHALGHGGPVSLNDFLEESATMIANPF